MSADKAIDFIIEKAPEYAKAKANRKYLEEYRKTVKARLYQLAPGNTIPEKESWAYAHKEYESVLDGIRAAVEIEEELLWKMKAAEHRLEKWRTEQANNRYLDKVTM